MRPRLEKRLDELKAEFESGQKMSADLEVRQANLKDTLLRITGAIQVIEELLDKENRPTGREEGQLNEQHERVIQQHEPLPGKA